MRRVASGTRKGEKLMKGVLMSRLLLWASGLSSAGHLLRDSVTWAKKFPPEGQELPPSLDENGPGGVISLTVPVCLQVLSYSTGKECLYVGRYRNSRWSYPEWKKGEAEGIWSWQGQPATVFDSCVSFWKAGCELHSPLYTQNTQHAALYLGGACLLLINEGISIRHI